MDGSKPGVEGDEAVGGGEAGEELFCAGDRGGAIDVEGVLAAVVEDNVAGDAAGVIALDERGQSRGDVIDVGGLPVGCHCVPGDRGEAEGSGGAQRVGSARAEGGSKEANRLAEDGFELVLGAGEFFEGLAVAGEGKVGMAPAMVGDGVAGLVHLADESGLECGVFADEEEGGAGVVAGENLEQLRGPAGIGAVVEGEGDLVGACRRLEGAAVELRGGPVGGKERAAGEQGYCAGGEGELGHDVDRFHPMKPFA